VIKASTGASQQSPSPIFETLFIILFDFVLSLQDLYGIIAALGFFFPIILVYPSYNSYRLLELARRRCCFIGVYIDSNHRDSWI
jgi:hypothetical protein